MTRHIWLRLGQELPNGELATLAQAYTEAQFTSGETVRDSDAIEAVFTNSLLPDETTQRLASLKWIHTTFGGGMAFQTPAVVARGIKVTSSRGVQAIPLAEFTETCVLALTKQFPLLARYKEERRWDETLRLDTLAGKTALLLGLGAVNSIVAERLHERGMRVQAIRRDLANKPACVDRIAGWDALPSLLAETDFLIIALPGSPQLRHRIGEAELRALKPTSYVINLVTRGIIADDVLTRGLTEGWIAGAACNVFETNPLPPESPLWRASNLIISPNIAQGDRQRWRKLKDIFTENLRRYLKGDPLMNIVGAAGGY
jgi:phosphoglycerate dehydrogenase-like enzyme